MNDIGIRIKSYAPSQDCPKKNWAGGLGFRERLLINMKKEVSPIFQSIL